MIFALLINEIPFQHFQTKRPVEFIADNDDKLKGTRRSDVQNKN